MSSDSTFAKRLRRSTRATVDGFSTHDLTRRFRQDLPLMIRCCEAELEKFIQSGYTYKLSPFCFERVAILSRKVKDYEQEIYWSERYLTAVVKYRQSMIAKGLRFVDPLASESYCGFKTRLVKARRYLDG